MKYKKILATVGSVLMLGATMAGAFATSYPVPFSSGAVVVVGANAASTDMVAATSINSNLAGRLVTGTGSVSVEGGDSIKIQRASQKFNLNQNMRGVFSMDLTKTELPVLLADGTFRGKDNKEYRYNQRVVLSEDMKLTHFSDYDLNEEKPVIGFQIASGKKVLSYALEFVSAPEDTTLVERNIKMLDKNYYILGVNANAGKVTLLDSANSAFVEEGETKSLTAGGKPYIVAISSISGSGATAEARLVINGETTEAVGKADTYRLADGSYVGVKDIIVGTRERDLHKVEVSIGSGKMELENATSIKLNERTNVRELTADVTFGDGKLQTLGFTWITDKEEFIIPGGELNVPLFGNIKVALTGVNFPKQEQVKVEADGRNAIRLVAPIKDGEARIPLVYTNDTSGALRGLGRDRNNRLVTSSSQNIVVNESAKDRWFITSWVSNTEAESYLVSATTSFDADDKDTVTIKNEITGENFCENVLNGRTCKIGNTVLTVNSVHASASKRVVNLTADTAKTTFNHLYTVEGLKVYLPVVVNGSHIANSTMGELYLGDNTTASTRSTMGNASFWNLFMQEEDKDNKLGNGKAFFFNIQANSGDNKDMQVNSINQSLLRVQRTDDYEAYIGSELSTKVVHKTSSKGQDSAVITYHGAEVSADVYVASPGASAVGEVGTMVATDAETAKITGKNLIVVGGSAINSVAARLLGGALSESAFTTATGVGPGQFLIQSFAREGKVALLVAGYEAADTTKAATYLVNNVVDTTVGAKEVKSSTVVASTA